MGRNKGAAKSVAKPKVVEKEEVDVVEKAAANTTAKKSKKVKFRKLGGGSITIEGKEYTGGDTFKALEGSIPKAFADLVEKV